MPRIRVGDLDVYYELLGQGRRLLFINGSGGDLRQKPRFTDGPLVEHFEVLAYDQRGLGQTTRPAGPYTMAQYADDAAALLDALAWERCAILGVSFGGMVAQELAIRHPDRIARMVLACTSSGGAGQPSYPLHELEGLPAEERGLRAMELSDTRCDAQWREAHPEATARILGMMASRAQTGAGEQGREEGMRLQLEARSHHDTFDRLRELAMPVYLCGGRHDGIAPPANMEAIDRQIPDSTLEFFEGGHLFLMQDPAAFPRIIEFLNDGPDPVAGIVA
jgi:3-oxoadipate enol-lactonase